MYRNESGSLPERILFVGVEQTVALRAADAGGERDGAPGAAAGALAAETGDFKSAIEEAIVSLDSGQALAKLDALIQYSQSFQVLQ